MPISEVAHSIGKSYRRTALRKPIRRGPGAGSRGKPNLLAVVFLASLIALTTSFPAYADTASGAFELVGENAGKVNVAVERDGLLYVVLGSDLRIGEHTAGNAVQWVGWLHLPVAIVVDLVLDGNLAYLAAGDDGLRIVDIADPTRPRALGAVETAGTALSLAVLDHTVFVADYGRGLAVVEVEDPGHPTVLTTARLCGGHHLAIVDHYVYVVGGDAITVCDIVESTRPTVVAVLRLSGDWANDLVVAENHMIIATAHGLAVLDIRDPAAPRLIYQPTPSNQYAPIVSVAYSNGIALVYRLPGYRTAWGSLIAAKPELRTIDVNEPTALVPVDQIDLGDWGADWPFFARIQSVDSHALVAANGDQLWSVEIAPDGRFRTVRPTTMAFSGVNLAAGDGLAYVSDRQGMTRIVDVADPARLYMTADWPWNPFGRDVAGPSVGRADVVGDRTYLASARGLEILDAADPVSPRLLGMHATGYGATDVKVAGGYAYLVHGEVNSPTDATHPEFQVIDVADSSNPRLVSQLQLPGTPHRLAVTDHSAIITVDSNAQDVLVVDIAQPARPRLAGQLNVLTAEPWGVAADEASMFLAAPSGGRPSDAGLWVASMRYPSSPCVSAFLRYRFGPQAIMDGGNVAIRGNRAFLAAGRAGLRAIDITDRSQPRELGSWLLPQPVQDVAISGDVILVVSEHVRLSRPFPLEVGGGLYALHWSESPALTLHTPGSNARRAINAEPLPRLALRQAALPADLFLPWLSCACPDRCE